MMTTSTTKLAGFGLLIACLCCSTLPLVSSEADIKSVPVKYSGDTTLRENQKEWSVSCEVPPEVTQISWKRNGQVLSELSSGEMTVSPPRKNGTVKVSTLSASEVKPDYEGTYTCVDGGNDSHQITILYDVTVVVVAPKNDSVTIECNEQEGKWFKDDSPINSTDGLPVIKSDGTLIISTLAFSKLAQADSLYGKYSCRGSNGTTDFRVVKKPVVKTEDYQNVVEEEKMHLTCTLSVPDPKFPDPNLKIMWTFKGRNYSSSDGRVKLTRDSENNVKNAVFTLENIEMDDRGNIACVAYYNLHDLGNPQRHGIDTTFVRVKDKYAALWPFLGICAEVVILCLIILIYEKKRNKSELEESDTDQSPDTKPTPNKDSDVRQRK